MDRCAAHYIFTGQKVLRKAVLAKDEANTICSLSDNDAMAIEYSNTIFYNGVICPQIASASSTVKGGLVLNVYEPITSKPNLKSEATYISFKNDDYTSLFKYLDQLQNLGCDFFDILKVLTQNNYVANGQKAPLIEVGKNCPVSLFKGLRLSDLAFTPQSTYQLL